MKINKDTFVYLILIGAIGYLVLNSINEVTLSYHDEKGTKKEAKLTELLAQLAQLTKENQQLSEQLKNK